MTGSPPSAIRRHVPGDGGHGSAEFGIELPTGRGALVGVSGTAARRRRTQRQGRSEHTTIATSAGRELWHQ
jgi:hypothetical protein